MANPTKIVVTDRAFSFAMTTAQVTTMTAQTPPVPFRPVDAALDTYGLQTPGKSLCRLLPGDTFTDAGLITLLLALSPASLNSVDYPNAFLPMLQDAH